MGVIAAGVLVWWIWSVFADDQSGILLFVTIGFLLLGVPFALLLLFFFLISPGDPPP
jgi:hypothetical protein